MKIKIVAFAVIFMLTTTFIYNTSLAESNTIREHLFYVDIERISSSSDFWDLGGDIDTNSDRLLSSIKSNPDLNPTSLEILAMFIKWLNGVNYQTLASDNDSNYLEIAQIALSSGEKELVSNGNIREGETKEEHLLEVFNTYFGYTTGSNADVTNSMPIFYRDIERQMQRVKAAIDYKKETGRIMESFDKKKYYTSTQVKQYLQDYGTRYNIKQGTSLNNLKMAWSEGVSLNDGTNTKLGYNATQIKSYFKIADASHSLNSSNDTLITEWYTVIKEGKHTDWYNNNIQNGELRTNNNNKELTNTEKSNMINEIRSYCASEWTDAEIANAEQKLTEIAESAYDARFALNTGYTMQTAAANAGENSRADESHAEGEDKDDKDKYTVFKMPNGTGDVPNGIQDVANDASQFLNGGNTNGLIQEGALQDFSQNIYSMLLGVGIVVAVIVGLLIGIKLMLAPIEERAEAKKLLIPYIAGCAIVFGSFGIWKLVVTLLSGV